MNRGDASKIQGCDFHPGWQQVAVFDAETGEIRKLKLENGNGEAERFYRQLCSRTTEGMMRTTCCDISEYSLTSTSTAI